MCIRDSDKTMRLLKTARGQIEGIMKMVEEDRYCIDISTQLMATQSLIGRINADVLKAHICLLYTSYGLQMCNLGTGANYTSPQCAECARRQFWLRLTHPSE